LSKHPIFSETTLSQIKDYDVNKFPANPVPDKTRSVGKKRKLKEKLLRHNYDHLRELAYLKANENQASSAREDPTSCKKGSLVLYNYIFVLISIYCMIGTRLYYDNTDGLPEHCHEIILFSALLELHFVRHELQGFTHMFDCNNMHHEDVSCKVKTTTCTSVEQKSHIDYSQLLASILNINGNRETIFWNLPLSFVVGVDDGVSLRFHTSVNDALLRNSETEVKAMFSLKEREFNKKYPMTSISVKPGHVVIFSGTKNCLRLHIVITYPFCINIVCTLI